MNMRAWFAALGMAIMLAWLVHPSARAQADHTSQDCRSCTKDGREQAFAVCDSASGCRFDVDVTLDGGRCVAKLPYCGLCVRKSGTGTIVWRLVNKTGSKNYVFGSQAQPDDGIRLGGPRSNKPGEPRTREHFNGRLQRPSRTEFEWKRGADPTWGPVSLPRNGHDAVVSEAGPDGRPSGVPCRPADPPIINTSD